MAFSAWRSFIASRAQRSQERLEIESLHCLGSGLRRPRDPEQPVADFDLGLRAAALHLRGSDHCGACVVKLLFPCFRRNPQGFSQSSLQSNVVLPRVDLAALQSVTGTVSINVSLPACRQSPMS